MKLMADSTNILFVHSYKNGIQNLPTDISGVSAIATKYKVSYMTATVVTLIHQKEPNIGDIANPLYKSLYYCKSLDEHLPVNSTDFTLEFALIEYFFHVPIMS